MTTLDNYSDLPLVIRNHFAALELFIGDMDGKSIVTFADNNTFFDDGTVDAEEAVIAFNGLVAIFRSKTQ